MLLVDSHCHLNFPDFQDDLDAVIARARAAGVGVMQTICTEMEEFEQVRHIAEKYENMYCSVGVHPNESGVKRLASLEELLLAAAHPKVIGIGETGLDYHYETSAHAAQRESFRVHIRAARQSGLPLIVHTRDAEKDTLALLGEEMALGAFTGLIHCFTASADFAKEALGLGFYISISGIVSFKSAESLRAAVADIPLSRLIIETDSPFLAPLPYRGKRNEPAYVSEVNRMLAHVKQVSEAEMAAASSANFFALFTKAVRPV